MNNTYDHCPERRGAGERLEMNPPKTLASPSLVHIRNGPVHRSATRNAVTGLPGGGASTCGSHVPLAPLSDTNPASCGCWQGVFDFASDLGIIGEGLLPVDAGVWVAGVSKAEQVARPDH